MTLPGGGAGGSTVIIGWGLAVALVVLVAIAVTATRLAGLGSARQIGTASARAVLQLAVVSVVIVAVDVPLVWLVGGAARSGVVITPRRCLPAEDRDQGRDKTAVLAGEVAWLERWRRLRGVVVDHAEQSFGPERCFGSSITARHD